MERSADHLDLGLDLLLREMELHAQSLSNFRNAVATSLTLGVTVEAVLITSLFERTNPSAAKLGLGFAALGVFLAVGVVLMSWSRGSVKWPDGAALVKERSGSTLDFKRQLINEFRSAIDEVTKNFRNLQIGFALLVVLLAGSIGSWIWILKTTSLVVKTTTHTP